MQGGSYRQESGNSSEWNSFDVAQLPTDGYGFVRATLLRIEIAITKLRNMDPLDTDDRSRRWAEGTTTLGSAGLFVLSMVRSGFGDCVDMDPEFGTGVDRRPVTIAEMLTDMEQAMVCAQFAMDVADVTPTAAEVYCTREIANTIGLLREVIQQHRPIEDTKDDS